MRKLRQLPISCWLACVMIATASAQGTDWPQWGGPDRNFRVPTAHQLSSWDQRTPREVFQHPLSGGHAAVTIAHDLVFVQHGKKRTERLTALRRDGQVAWEATYPVAYNASIASHDGPHATPTIIGDRLISVAIDATVRAWRIADGSLIWKRDLRAEHNVSLPQAGYAASPLPCGDLLLLPGLGAKGPNYTRVEQDGLGVIALDVKTGATRWQAHRFTASHASPIPGTIAGQSTVIFHGMEQLVLLDATGRNLRARFRLRTGAADNVSFTPFFDEASSTLYLSHAYDAFGMQAIRLAQDGQAERIWHNRRLKVEHGNVLLHNDVLIASHGGDPAFLVGLNPRTGEQHWRRRMPKANGVAVGNQVLLLDEDGTLHLCRPDRNSPGIVSSLAVLEETCWTAPTVVGRTVFVRSPSRLRALELPID